MKIILRNYIENFSLPLPVYHSIHIADAIGKDGEEFDVMVGLDKKYAEQLKQFSLDENDIDLQNNTGDRARFGEGRYEDWYAKNRTPFYLIHKQTDALATLVWFGPKTLLSDGMNWQAVAWRSYIPFRGKGIMKDFTKFVMSIYQKSFPDSKFWVILKRNNLGSAQLAVDLDFEILEEASDDISFVMTKK